MWIALLGRRDTPTDGVEDYCTFLGQALARPGVCLKKVQVQWSERGWVAALRQLWRESADWRGKWVLLQYTGLGWSRRGFPLPVLIVLWVLRRRAARSVVVFHDASIAASPRLLDRVRNAVQSWIMRKLMEQSEQGVLTVPRETLNWLPAGPIRAASIPIGANVPDYRGNRMFSAERTPKTVAVFSVTCGDTRSQEVYDIALAAKRVKQRVGPVRLKVFGRGSEEARELLERSLNGSGIELHVRGVIPAEEITRTLSGADVMLCARGLTTARRGTAIAGIACGLPVVGYGKPGSDPAIDAAGVRLAPWHNSELLADELTKVLSDEKLWQELHERNLRAHTQYFSWDAIADRYVELLALPEVPARTADTRFRGGVELPENDRRMKILIYSHDWAPSIGGVQTVTMSLARGLAEWHEGQARATAQVTVVTATPADGMDDSALPFRVVRRPGVIELVRLLRSADLIHLAGPSLLPLFLGWLLDRLMVVEHHSFQAACPSGLLFYEPDQAPCPGHFMARRYRECLRCNRASAGSWKSLLLLFATFPRRWFSEKTSVNLTPTNWLASVICLRRMITIPHGVYEEAASGIPRASSPITFAFLGRLVPLKGVRYLLQAANRLEHMGFTFRLKIIGDGPERGELERMAHELGLNGCVEFLGYVPPEKLEQSMADAHAVVLPSLGGEVFGLAAVESMRHGRVAIVPAGGAMAEVVGDAGLQFPPADVEGLTQCLRSFLEDSALRLKLSRRGQARFRELYEERRMIKQHIDFYRKLLGAKGQPAAKSRDSVATHA